MGEDDLDWDFFFLIFVGHPKNLKPKCVILINQNAVLNYLIQIIADVLVYSTLDGDEWSIG